LFILLAAFLVLVSYLRGAAEMKRDIEARGYKAIYKDWHPLVEPAGVMR